MKKLLLSALGTVALAFAMWAGSAIVDDARRVSALEAQQAAMSRWLERVEDKLDRVLDRRE